MPLPSDSYMTLVGGLNSTNSTIYTGNLIKIGDVVKISGTASNNGTFTVTNIISNANTAEGSGTTFTDATCDTTNTDATVTHDANDQIVAGLSVSGTGIPASTYIASITNSTTFELTKPATASNTNTTLTFGDMDIYYTLKGGTITNETSATSTDPQIEVVRAPGDKLVALGDVDSANGVDIWSNNATTDYAGTSPASADGWEASAISPTLNGNNAKYIYHFADEALRVCNINEENTSMVKWYGYIQRQQFNNQKGALFAEWQEHPNSLASPKIAEGTFTYCYGHATHDGTDNAASYYQNNRGVARVKKDTTSDLQLNGSHNDSTTAFTFENSSSENVLDQASTGEVITIDEALGVFPKEFLFCKKEASVEGQTTITYSRAYGGALVGGTAPDSYSDHDTPIIERGLGFNIAVSDGSARGEWEDGTYEFYQSFVYDGNQESIPVQMGGGQADDSLEAFTHTADGQKSLRLSVFADVVYSGRITGGRVYTRLSGTDDDLILIADIDIVKGVRTTMEGDHVAWTYDSDADDGYYFEGDATGNIPRPGIDTYTSINGFGPDVNFVAIGGKGEIYKASVVANRRTFIANVKIKGTGGELEKFGDRIMYSEIGKYDTFVEHNFIDVSKGDYGEYTALESYADRLLAFKHNLVHIINISSPSVSNWYLEETVKHFGVNHPFSVTKTNNGIVWASDDGCYLYNGSTVTNLIDRKIAVNMASYTTTDVNWQSWYRGSALAKDVMLGYDPISNSLLMVRSPSDNTTTSNTGWVYDFDSKGWTYHTRLFSDSYISTNFIVDWNNNLSFGLKNSSTIEFKKFLPVSASSSEQELVTRDIDFGEPGLTKKIYKVVVTYKSSATQANPMEYSVDGKQSWTDITTGDGTITTGAGDSDTLPTSSAWDVAVFKPASPIACQSIQLRLNLPSSGTFEINDMTIEYRTIRGKEAS
tara:strand:- start:3012 stop:5825 length:2814 start_codon:yes stop_codon:yes gene_type:complete